MTEADLSKYFWLVKEIETMEKELNDTYEDDELTKTRKVILDKKMKTAARELLTIEDFLESLEDPEMRLIFRLRYCLRMTWEAIGCEVHMHHTTVLRKHRAFLKAAQNAQ